MLPVALRIRITVLWQRLRASYWFIPAVMALVAAMLAYGMVMLDSRVLAQHDEQERALFARSGAEGARAVLGGIAAAMITVAGTVFSITIVTLSLASQQFGPRLLRNFMRDRGNQFVLGTFTATYLYCLIVLRTVSGLEDAQFVPHASVTVGVGLAMLSVGVLIYFIHHVAMSIQVSNLVAVVSDELHEEIEKLFPDRLGRERANGITPEAAVEAVREQGDPIAVCSPRRGYIQTVDDEALVAAAVRHDLLVRLEARPGDFVLPEQPCVTVWAADRDPERVREAEEAVLAALAIGSVRNAAQDAEFSLNQLIEVAARALSASTNDPFTAIACIDQLGAALAKLARREMPGSVRVDEAGRPRVIAQPTTLRALASRAVGTLFEYGANHRLVTEHLADTCRRVAAFAVREDDRAFLLEQAAMVQRRRNADEHKNEV